MINLAHTNLDVEFVDPDHKAPTTIGDDTSLQTKKIVHNLSLPL